MNENLTYF
jgi:hypothetical protein